MPSKILGQNPFKIAVVKQDIRVRNIFRVSKERHLVSADYCQLELRMLAHLSGDEKLLAAFNSSNQDPFILLGRQWLKKEEISTEERKRVKARVRNRESPDRAL